MKTPTIIALTAVMAVLLQPADAVRKIKHVTKTHDPDQNHREMVHFTLAFEECTHKTLAACEAIIAQLLIDQPALFEGRESVEYFVHHIRHSGDKDYAVMGLMTNFAGTGIVGYNGDGIIRYANPDFDNNNVWCTHDSPCDDHNRILHITDKCCFRIGPWDCDTGVPKSIEDCCHMIQSTVPAHDYHGSMVTCHPVYPLGSDNNPINYDRVYIRVNSDGIVVGEPMNQ